MTEYVTKSEIMKRYGLKDKNAMTLLKNVPFEKREGTTAFFYKWADVEPVINRFLAIPRTVPAGMMLKSEAFLQLGISSNKSAKIFNDDNCPEPRGYYWNGNKALPFYHIDEMKKFVAKIGGEIQSNGTRKGCQPEIDYFETDDDDKWPVPAPPVVSPHIKAFLRWDFRTP